MYSNLKSVVKRESCISDTFPCMTGTRQGCNMSPTLFKLFLRDLQDVFMYKESDPVKIDRTPAGCCDTQSKCTRVTEFSTQREQTL